MPWIWWCCPWNALVLLLVRVVAGVFVAYFRAHTRGTGTPEVPCSRPIAVKIDRKHKMRDERSRVKQLPPLAGLAKPIACLDLTPIDDDRAILIAPFRSIDEPPEEIKVKDLWTVLQTADGPRDCALVDAWPRVSRHVKGALEIVDRLHQGEGRGRRTQSYAEALEWYLRETRIAGGSPGSRAHYPRGIFGDAPRVNALGRDWVKPDPRRRAAPKTLADVRSCHRRRSR